MDNNRQFKPENYWCIWCALSDEEFVPATRFVYDEVEDKIYPCCERCFKEMEQEEMDMKTFFTVFSNN